MKKKVVEVAVRLDHYTGMTFRFDRLTPDGRVQGKNRCPRNPQRFVEPIVNVHFQDVGDKWRCRPWYGGGLGFVLQDIKERKRILDAQKDFSAAAR